MTPSQTDKKIVSTAARLAGDIERLAGAVAEVETCDARGDVVLAEQALRTLEDLAGHRLDGYFVSGRRIVEAFALCREFPI